MQCTISSGILKSLTYLKIIHPNNDANLAFQCNLPSAHDLLYIFRGLDVKRLRRDANGFRKVLREADDGNRETNHRLNFVHYIKQCRSAYAVYLMLTDQLQSYAQITKTHLFTTCESVYEVALQTAITDYEVISHCIAFCEMLGVDTKQLRCVIKLRQCLRNHDSNVVTSSKDLTFNIQDLERLLIKQLSIKDNDKAFPLNDFNAIMTCKNSIPINLANKDNVSLVMQHFAQNDDYWHLLVLIHYYEVPLEQIRYLAKYFGIDTMGDHLLRALSFAATLPEGISLKRRSSATKRQLIWNKQKKGERRATNTSIETMTSSVTSGNDTPSTIQGSFANHNNFFTKCTNNGGLDIFALILINMSTSNAENERIDDLSSFLEQIHSQRSSTKPEASTIVKFLRTAIEQHFPIMAILAASVDKLDGSNSNLEWCWLVWLVVTTDQWSNFQRFSSNTQEFPWNLFDHIVSQSQITSIVRSFEIFYPDTALIHLFRFLQLSTQNKFGDETVHELRLYCLAWSNEEVHLPFNLWPQREKLMKRTIRILLLHIQHNFESTIDQLKFLGCVCRSGLSDITGQLDFCLLKRVCDILMTVQRAAQRFPINFVQLLQNDHRGDTREYERILRCILAAKEYDVAIQFASLLNKPISDIIYSKWVKSLELQLASSSTHAFDNYVFPFDQYENEVSLHSLPPETLVNFLLYASSHLPTDAYKSRYYVLQKALNVIKHHRLFPNESFDRDQIEYDMIINYLYLDDVSNGVADLMLYHSEYFEEIMLSERKVLYKTFLELKELAGIDDLNISNKVNLNEKHSKRLEVLLHRLLDEGDIVEALRLQELFDIRPLDLRFLVFCMALAESMSTVYCMSADERQLLGEIERSSFSKFTKRTLCSAGAGSYLSDSCSTLEFEEIPSKEKQETLTVLQGIASKLKYGVNLAKRIISCYRAAMYLDKEYVDVLRTKDVNVLLQSIAEEICLHRLLVVSDILTSTHMEPKEIAELLSFEIATAVVRPRFYIFSSDQQAKLSFRNADLWGYNIDRDLHLFLELTPDRTKLGACLLEYCDALKEYRRYQDNKPYEATEYFNRLAEIIARYGLPSVSNAHNVTSGEINLLSTNQSRPPQVLSHKKQNIIYVELLIKAHQAFVHECSMEGIANVLNRAKALNNILAQAKSWSLIVRMLTGIGRYREMYFCFDTLIENEQFESLLGQFDEEKTIGLRQAILAYLREYCAPQQGKELFKLAALHFLMYKDLAELWDQDAEEILNNVHNSMSLSDDSALDVRKLRCTPDLINQLNQALEYFVHATENYLLDNKLLLAQKSAAKAELTAMQMDLVNKGLEKVATSSGNHVCLCVIQLKSRQQFKSLVNDDLR